MSMKQPQSYITEFEEDGTFYIDMGYNYHPSFGCGRTPLTAWKNAKRRLEKMLSDCEKKIEEYSK